ncbi:MAG: hypothetical protein GEV05_04605 [Betaproteobacteria bacterium]|nr:hypothetical protein [Betaproteobacteria bacterium]
MRIAIRYAVISGTFGALLACTQPGDEHVRPEPQGAPERGESCAPPQDCPAPKPPGRAAKPVKPAVPAVPDSPIKVDCTKLPTQLERDTCTNRKQSTG